VKEVKATALKRGEISQTNESPHAQEIHSPSPSIPLPCKYIETAASEQKLKIWRYHSSPAVRISQLHIHKQKRGSQALSFSPVVSPLLKGSLETVYSDLFVTVTVHGPSCDLTFRANFSSQRAIELRTALSLFLRHGLYLYSFTAWRGS
jgi:hypothetical protein